MLRRKGPLIFISPSSKGSFFSLSPENQKELSLNNPSLQLGDMYKFREVISKYKTHCSESNIKFDLRNLLNLKTRSCLLSPFEFGKKKLRGTTKIDRVEIFSEGYKPFTNSQFLDLVKLLAPQVVTGLTEEKRDFHSRGKKTSKRNVAKTSEFFRQLAKVKNEIASESKLVYAFQGEHYQEIREEAIEFIGKEIESIDGIYICGVYDESEIVNDSVLAKRASKFYNFYKKKKKQKEVSDNANHDKTKNGDLSKTNNPQEAKNGSTEQKNLSSNYKKSQNKTNSKTLAEILKNRKSDPNSQKTQNPTFESTYNHQNRKMVYNLLQPYIPQTEKPQTTPARLRFNDLSALFKSQPHPAILLSSDGEFFKILEGAWFGVQGFQAGYPFEVSKHQSVIGLDFKKWALLVRYFLRQSHDVKKVRSSQYFFDWVEENEDKGLRELIREIGGNEGKEDGVGVELGKRGEEAFQGQTGEIVSWDEIFNGLEKDRSRNFNIDDPGINL